jgi:hypothetical protein
MAMTDIEKREPKEIIFRGYPIKFEPVTGTNRDFLHRTLTPLYIDIFGRDPRLSESIVASKIAKDGTMVARVFDPADPKGEKAVGYGIMRPLSVETSSGDQSKVTFISRGFKREHEGHGVGTHLVEESATINGDDTDYISLDTQSPPSIYTLEKARERRTDLFGDLYPRTRWYGGDSPEGRKAQDVIIGTVGIVRRNPSKFDIVTGLSEAELGVEGMNRAYIEHTDHRETMEILRWLVMKIGMNRERGDVIYMLMEVIRSQPVEITNSDTKDLGSLITNPTSLVARLKSGSRVAA